MALPEKSVGTGRAVDGGAMKVPKPSSTRLGGTTSCTSWCLALPAAATLRRAGEIDDAFEHFDEGARERQVRPARVAGDVEQHDQAFAAPRGGDQRRTVGERRPGVVAQRRIGLRQHLPGHGHVVRHRHAVERTVARKRRERLRLVPAQAPPRMRPPRRSFTGTRSSSEAASRGPAKRTSTPPSSTQCASRSCASPATVPTSARISMGSL